MHILFPYISRDAIQTSCLRGGGVPVAIDCISQTSVVAFDNDDSILDQLCVCVNGMLGNLFECVSNIPAFSSEILYAAHVNKIWEIYKNNEDSDFCILGDFNLNKKNY